MLVLMFEKFWPRSSARGGGRRVSCVFNSDSGLPMSGEGAPETDNRSVGRSNVFLSASLRVGGRSIAVRIRNLSALGAQVEAPGLPSVGTKVGLSRGSLNALGHVAWQKGEQAGVNFDTPIDVSIWVRRVGHAGQQRVDAAISAIMQSRVAAELPAVTQGQISESD